MIGGVALVLHGSARTTQDIDICYSRTPENLTALCGALAPLQPWLRGAPRELPFRLDVPTLKAGLNFTLQTELGDLDLLGEVPGVGDFSVVAASADWMELFGRPVRVMGLDALEKAKRAAGRTKDTLDLGEIELIRRRKPS